MSYPKQPFYSSNHQPLGSVIRSPLLQAIDQNNLVACEELIQSNEEQVHEVVSDILYLLQIIGLCF